MEYAVITLSDGSQKLFNNMDKRDIFEEIAYRSHKGFIKINEETYINISAIMTIHNEDFDF